MKHSQDYQALTHLVWTSKSQSSCPTNTVWALLVELSSPLYKLSSIGALECQLPLFHDWLSEIDKQPLCVLSLIFLRLNIPSSFKQCPQASVVSPVCFPWSWVHPVWPSSPESTGPHRIPTVGSQGEQIYFLSALLWKPGKLFDQGEVSYKTVIGSHFLGGY